MTLMSPAACQPAWVSRQGQGQCHQDTRRRAVTGKKTFCYMTGKCSLANCLSFISLKSSSCAHLTQLLKIPANMTVSPGYICLRLKPGGEWSLCSSAPFCSSLCLPGGNPTPPHSPLPPEFPSLVCAGRSGDHC